MFIQYYLKNVYSDIIFIKILKKICFIRQFNLYLSVIYLCAYWYSYNNDLDVLILNI